MHLTTSAVLHTSYIHHEQQATIHLRPSEVGEAYELLVTTRGGLCRYRLGDVVRLVSQQEGQMPLVQLQGRVGKTLTLCGLDEMRGERPGFQFEKEFMASTWALIFVSG